MPATTENLLEEIKSVTLSLQNAVDSGDQAEATRLSSVLGELKSRFTRANEVLNENRSILKG